MKHLDGTEWKVKKIGVIGPGIVGMPMAALLAHARIRIGSEEPAKVVVVQRNSPHSGWKVAAINQGRSVIGGIEPGLDDIVRESVQEGLLSASHDYSVLNDADVVLVAIQTDKKGLEPDYGPLFSGLTDLAVALQKKPSGKIPLVIFESTLAPSTMDTLIKPFFASYGLQEGKDILLGNSPNRVMPGRLVERIAQADKLVAGLHPLTPQLIRQLYSFIVTRAELHTTNSYTAEIVKTLENAYRDVRIAFSAEIVRYCDDNDIDFYALRDEVNKELARPDESSSNPTAVPTGAMLIPALGVGGHCLPKDGILLWWRKLEKDGPSSDSLILKAREINDEAPAKTLELAEKHFGSLNGKSVALLGAAYRFNSEDTRNSPTLVFARELISKGCRVVLHDPFVKKDDQNILRYGFSDILTHNLSEALREAEYIFVCTAHSMYVDGLSEILSSAPMARGLFDACNAYPQKNLNQETVRMAGIGKGRKTPSPTFVDFVYKGFRAMETGVANEVAMLCNFFNQEYHLNEFNRVHYGRVRELAGTCTTGCDLAVPGQVTHSVEYDGFIPRLVQCALQQARTNTFSAL